MESPENKQSEVLHARLYTPAICLLIALIHIVMAARGIHVVRMEWWWHLLDDREMHHDFLRSIYYFHGNPPGLSILTRLADEVSFGHRYELLWAILTGMHILSFYAFRQAAQKAVRFDSRIPVALIFLNPFIFIYFNYFYNVTLMLCAWCCLLWLWFSTASGSKKTIVTFTVFCFFCLIRSSWHIGIVLAAGIWMLSFWDRPKAKYIALMVFLFALPLSVYIKNYIVFGKFTTSTWLGMNLCRSNMPYNCDKPISKLEPFVPVPEYAKVINLDIPYVNKFKNIAQLNKANFNNVRYIVIADSSLEAFKQCFSIPFSLKSWALHGLNNYFNSPSDFIFIYSVKWGEPFPWYSLDFFDLPDLHYTTASGNKYDVHLAWYMILYPLVMSVLLLKWTSLPAGLKIACAVLWLYFFMYTIVDPFEANRMRFENEPLFWFAILYIWSERKSLFGKKALPATVRI
ncbi:MAG: hypothetical protein V4543_10430 [Bacteroidota bacterium]